MRIVDSSESLANPNVCAICEETPKPATETVIDTQHSKFDDWSHTQGQKYICERCATEIAKLTGFVPASAAADAIRAAGAASAQLANVQARVTELANGIAAFVNQTGAGDSSAHEAVFTSHSPAAAAVEAVAEEVAASYEDVFGPAEPVDEKPTKKASKDSEVGSKQES